MLDVHITNADTGRGDWITFPATKARVQELFAKIGVNEASPGAYSFSEYHVGIVGIKGLHEHADINEINYFAALLDQLSFENVDRFEAAALHDLYSENLKGQINLVQNPDCFEYYPGVGDNEELGRYLIDVLNAGEVPGWIEPYFDYAAYGRDFATSKGGVFVDTGFVYRNDEPFVERYDGRHIPEEYVVCGAPAPPEKMPIKDQLAMYEKMAGAASVTDRPAPDRADHADLWPSWPEVENTNQH